MHYTTGKSQRNGDHADHDDCSNGNPGNGKHPPTYDRNSNGINDSCINGHYYNDDRYNPLANYNSFDKGHYHPYQE
jgi:hypothetical protein